MFGRVAQTEAFEGVFRSGEDILADILVVGAQKLLRICGIPINSAGWHSSS